MPEFYIYTHMHKYSDPYSHIFVNTDPDQFVYKDADLHFDAHPHIHAYTYPVSIIYIDIYGHADKHAADIYKYSDFNGYFYHDTDFDHNGPSQPGQCVDHGCMLGSFPGQKRSWVCCI